MLIWSSENNDDIYSSSEEIADKQLRGEDDSPVGDGHNAMGDEDESGGLVSYIESDYRVKVL
jgi:hypothetical protein